METQRGQEVPADWIDDEAVPADWIELALSFALLAPSPRNTQPWAFSTRDDEVINLNFDRRRARPIADPRDRELTISCAVSLYFAQLALASLGADHVVTLHPDPRYPDHLAKIRLTGRANEPDQRAKDLVAAAIARRTYWYRFTDEDVPDSVLRKLKTAAAAEGADLRVVSGAERPVIESLVAKANDRQLGDPDFVAELALWPVGRPSPPEPSIGVKPARTEDETGGALVALSTRGDSEDQWLVAGTALASVLLTAAGLGLAVAFDNQPIQVQQTRAEVAQALGLDADVQQLLRFGYPPETADATPRRSLDEVLTPIVEPW